MALHTTYPELLSLTLESLEKHVGGMDEGLESSRPTVLEWMERMIVDRRCICVQVVCCSVGLGELQTAGVSWHFVTCSQRMQ